jgi:YVTN family beta-propeller protein
MIRYRLLCCLLLNGFLGCPSEQKPGVTVLEPPGVDSVPGISEKSAVLINGRQVEPAGRFIKVQSYNWGMALSRDESKVLLIGNNSLTVVSLGEKLESRRIPPFGFRQDKKYMQKYGEGGYMGCAFSPDGDTVYYGNANQGQIKVFDLKTNDLSGTIDINDADFRDSFLGDFVLSSDGSKIYAVDQFNYRMVTVDLKTQKVVQSVRVGRNPFGIRLSPDERFAWVSNVGMFEYPLLPGVTPATQRSAGLDFPAYGIPSKEAEEGVVVNSVRIPGLGSPNHPDAMSVFKVNLALGKVEQKIKTGYLVGAERDEIRTVGGASPGALAVGQKFIYVANATNDTISIIDSETDAIVSQVELKLPRMEKLRGILPFQLCLNADETRLYAACPALNAVAVIDLKARKVAGYIPAGWFCSIVRLSRDGRRLFVSSSKGLGSGPNGGTNFVNPDRGTHPADIMMGLFQEVPVPDDASLASYTEQVLRNTSRERAAEDDGTNPVPPVSGLRKSPIRHIVFIVKENRSFDQVFGQRRNVNGDPANADLGMKRTIFNEAKTVKLQDVDISPNHQALADQFAISDNFFCDSDQSNTGHRWVVGVYPNEWVEVNARARIEERIFSTAPGRRYVAGSSAAIFPEDYNEAGALWEHLTRHKVSFYNFGFGTEMPAAFEEQVFKYTGTHMNVSIPLPKPLFDHTSRKFATYNMAIPDQFRVDMFEEEFKEKWLSGKEPFPSLITMVLPNDHTTKEHPEDGYPFRESYFGDNDLALARVIRTLSTSPYWKDMLVIVTEDDPQGGKDHVDAHRSILMMIGPYVKRGHVSHQHASFGSIMKLIFTILDLPYLNQFDAAASLPRDFFTDKPDYTPYKIRQIDKRLFDPDAAFKPFDRRFNWKGILESEDMDKLEEMRDYFEKNN